MQRLRPAAVSTRTRVRPHRPLPARLARLACAALLCAAVAPLVGWSNGTSGGDSFGTHDWALHEANRLAMASGYAWLDTSVAQLSTDDPDTRLHDTYHHVYDIWGSSYGDAPTRIAAPYAETVTELKAGDRIAASKSFGLLSHYYSDVNNPLHTDQTPQEKAIHSRYELATQKYTDAPGENSSWVIPDGIRRVLDPAEETRLAAANAHRSYLALVGTYSQGGMTPAALAITRASLSRASNDLADLIASAAKDGGVSGTKVAEPEKPTAQGTSNVATQSVPSIDASTAGPTTPAEVATLAATASSTEPPAPRLPSSPNLTLVFWVVAGSVFSVALFGALSTGQVTKG